MVRRLKLTALITAIILLGFFREFFFMNWNEQARVAFYQANDSNVHSLMKWTEGFSYPALYFGKWVLTGLFVLLFYFLTRIILQLIFSDRSAGRVVTGFYVILVTAGLFIFLPGLFFEGETKFYAVSRFLMGIAQSVVPVMVLYIGMRLWR